MIVQLPHQFNPRIYQHELLKAFFIEGFKHVYFLCHRRAGKDLICINIITMAACQRVGTYLYLFPQHNQARKVIWKGIDGSGRRFLDYIPKQIISRINNTDMSVELINGSIIQLGGSNNFDSLMGTNPVGIIYSEHSLHNPLSRQYLNPILVENGGWEIVQGTPRGKNHSYHLFKNACNNPNWFVRKHTIVDTKKHDGSPVITEADVDAERRMGVADELLRQEYYCDWNVGVQGAYYTNELDAVEYQKRLCAFDVRPGLPTFTFWDIGVRDSTAIIFMQMSDGFVSIIDYYEANDKGVDHFARVLEEKRQKYGYKYTNHFGPHDLRNRVWAASARSVLSIASEWGIHFLIVPDVGLRNGIEAGRAIFRDVRIHTRCQGLFDALREYRREYDEENKVFKDKPLHNWASNLSDAWRYMAIIWRDQFTHLGQNSPRRYDSCVDENHRLY